MRKLFYLTAALAATVILYILPAPSVYAETAAGENLLKNGDFETAIFPDWVMELSRENLIVELSSKNKRSGKFSLKIDNSRGANDVRIYQKISVKPSTYYKLSGWIACENVNKNKVGANLSVINFLATKSVDITGNSDWKYVEYYFKTPEKNCMVDVGPRLGYFCNEVRGVAYFDDISLVELTGEPNAPYDTFFAAGEHGETAQKDAGDNLFINGDFENDLSGSWEIESSKPDKNVGLTSKKAYTGRYALKIDNANQAMDVSVFQRIDVKPSTFYKLSGWVACENVTEGKTGASLSIINFFDIKSPFISGTSKWRYIEFCFKTPEVPCNIAVGARLGYFCEEVEGTAYFDDLSLVELTSQPAKWKQLPPPREYQEKPQTICLDAVSFVKYLFIAVAIVLILINIVFLIPGIKAKPQKG